MLTCLLLAVLVPTAPGATWLAGEMTDPGPHPRTLVSPSTLDEVRGRLDREPYAGWARRTAAVADRTVDLDDHEPYPELSKANAARAAAWLFVLDRTVASGEVVPFATEADRDAMGERAVTYLLSMYTESRAKGPLDAVLDIYTAQELHAWADTLDLLLGADRDVLGSDREAAVQGVADLAADFYADFHLTNWQYTRSLLNNHRAKSAAAVGLAAIALNGEELTVVVDDGRYDMDRWVDFAIGSTDLTVRDALVDADGGYQEGGNYLEYGGLDVYPFLWAWSRYTGGASRLVVWDPDVPPHHVVGAVEPYLVPDQWTDPWLEEQLLWGVQTALPDGSFAPWDDSSAGARLFWGAFVHGDFALAGLWQWMAQRCGPFQGGSVETAPFLVATYDDAIPAQSPGELGLAPSAVLPWAGQVVFRSDWGPDAVHALLLAEHGIAAAWTRTRWGQILDSNGGHEHPDPAAISLFAGGEPLLLDQGYLGWDERGMTNAPSDHSLILVDGKGPEGPNLIVPPVEFGPEGEIVFLDPSVEGGWGPSRDGQAWVVAADLDTPGVGLAEVVTSYHVLVAETWIHRRATFLDDRFLVLHDAVQPTDDAEHRLTHLLHPACGGTSGGELILDDHGGRCVRDGAEVELVVLSPEPVERTTREDDHDGGGRQRLTHTALETSVQASGEVRFLTVVVPTTDAHEPVELVVGSGTAVDWTDGEVDCRAWVGAEELVGPGLLTATEGAWCRDDEALYGTFAGVSGDPDALVSARFELDGEQVVGWQVMAHDHSGEHASVVLPAVDGARIDGACGVAELGGDWEVQWPGPGVVHTAGEARDGVASARIGERGLREPPAVPVGEEVVLDATASCGAVGHRWRIERKPEMSGLSVVGATEALLVVVPDVPGVYELVVDVGGDEALVAFEAEGEPVPTEPSDTGEDDPEPDGCGCATGGAATGWLALALVPLARRRRSRVG